MSQLTSSNPIPFNPALVWEHINSEITQSLSDNTNRILILPSAPETPKTLNALFFIFAEDYIGNNQGIEEFPQLDRASEYEDCVIEVSINVFSTFPSSIPRFEFPQQPIHPSFKNGTICCGVSNDVKRNWKKEQSVFSAINKLCRSIASIPFQLTRKRASINLTRDCNFEMIRFINCNPNMCLEECANWAKTKAHISKYFSQAAIANFLQQNHSVPLIQKVTRRFEDSCERRTAHQIEMLKATSNLVNSLTYSQLKRIFLLAQATECTQQEGDTNYDQLIYYN